MNTKLPKTLTRALLASGISLLATLPAQAALNIPVPANATITHAGLQWAWVSPLGTGNDVDLTFQGTLGWRLPTAAELATAPTAAQFIFAGANANLNGTPDPASGANWQFTNGMQGFAALATPYFSNTFLHGDFCNGPGSGCGLNELPWNSGSFSEFVVVRGLRAGVPEPATWAMLVLGFGAIGGALRAARPRRAVTLRFA